MDTQLYAAIRHLHDLLKDRGVTGNVTLSVSTHREGEILRSLLSEGRREPASLMDLDAFLAQSEVIGL